MPIAALVVASGWVGQALTSAEFFLIWNPKAFFITSSFSLNPVFFGLVMAHLPRSNVYCGYIITAISALGQ